ncbi:MAG: subunit 3 of gluconate 2-dehydrogenase [Paenibacillaceae bacterium]|jgi:hypothetical protein|nr:subunit 3 of gluconate 2-dehydrogenase [Paenibacillaceae bacterium]
MSEQTHYPSYDVMEHKQAWDEHTRSIVSSRLFREHDYQFLTLGEAEVLRAWCIRLVDDPRGELIQFVLGHIDQTLHKQAGEGQRKPGVPPSRKLIRDGIAYIENLSMARHGKPFFHLDADEQQWLMEEFSNASAHLPEQHSPSSFPQKELFGKLHTLTLEAYYSHPQVWSEIGYAGPAYPRGYIRTQNGHLDSWEAKKEDD